MKKIDYQQENLKELLTLIHENPSLNIVPMVDTEICASDDFSTWMGGWGKGSVDEIYQGDERIYFKSFDLESLIESLSEQMELLNPAWSDEYVEEMATKEVEAYKWEKVILVHIVLPY
jgi:hypothetical protein